MEEADMMLGVFFVKIWGTNCRFVSFIDRCFGAGSTDNRLGTFCNRGNVTYSHVNDIKNIYSIDKFVKSAELNGKMENIR
jgi:hypothetical protein